MRSKYQIPSKGSTFGRLRVLTSNPSLGNGYRLNVICECGTRKLISMYSWGSTQSCGCLTVEVAAARFRTHGMRKTPEYDVWYEMVRRCHDKRHKDYKLYGGRGIRVCKRWRDSFAAFIADLGRRPPGRHLLDRIDNDAGYLPGNVAWVTDIVSVNNRRCTLRVTWNGKTRTLKAWSALLGIPYSRIYWHIHVKGRDPSVLFSKQALMSDPTGMVAA